MKINIGPYKNWFGPYQLAEALCFWVKDVEDEYGIEGKPQWVHTFGDFLAHGLPALKKKDRDVFNEEENLPETLLYRALKWIDSKKKRRVYIRIDKYDTWNMDRTLSMIILPMLKQLKETKHGSPMVEVADVPENLQQETDDAVHLRWDWVISEMIWAFEQHQPDCNWEEQYTTGVIDFRTEPSDLDENGKPKLYRLINGPNHTAVTDWEARNSHQERITNGFRLFGKYYQGLWD
jgi:hypothetical protein